MNSERRPKSNAAIIILAAGSSSRMGRSKQQLIISGEPLLRRTVTTAIASKAEKVIVVLGADKETHHQLIQDLPIEVIFNSDWRNGMGSSIKQGIDYVSKTSISAAILSVCDQPFLTNEIFNALIDQHELTGASVVASTYAGTVGVPVLFHRSTFQYFQHINDDEGAKKIILKYRDNIESVSFDQGEIDLDTTADYDSFISQSSSS